MLQKMLIDLLSIQFIKINCIDSKSIDWILKQMPYQNINIFFILNTVHNNDLHNNENLEKESKKEKAHEL